LNSYEEKSDNYYTVLSHSHNYQKIFNASNGALMLLEPIYNKHGSIIDARIKEKSDTIKHYINSQNTGELTLKNLMSDNYNLWIKALNLALTAEGQIYFKLYESINKKYFDIIVFNTISNKILVLIVDVSQLKKVEERFCEKILFLQNILDGIPIPAFYRDTCGNFQFANKAFEIALGLDKKEIIGQSLFKVLPEDLASKYREMDLDLLSNAGIQTYEWEFQNADGVTQRKRAQEALRISEEKFRSVLNQSPIGIGIYDPEGQLLDINLSMKEILGIESIEDVKHFNLFSDKHFKFVEEQILNNLSILSYEEELDFDRIKDVGALKTLKTGRSFIKYYISLLRYPDESIEGYLVHIQDITEQRRAVEALQSSETNLRRLTDNMIDMICQVNLVGDYEYITPSCTSVLGYEPDEMLGCSFYKFVHPQDVEKVHEHFRRVFFASTFWRKLQIIFP